MRTLKRGYDTPNTFGTLMQQFSRTHYQEKRVGFSALVKTGGVQDRAGLWMRVDKDKETLAFDNMQDRQLQATSDWKKYEIVLGCAARRNRHFLR